MRPELLPLMSVPQLAHLPQFARALWRAGIKDPQARQAALGNPAFVWQV